MKLIGNYLNKINVRAAREIDSKTIFHLFETIIREEYGRIGAINIKPRFYKDGKIFVNINGSNWANELWMNKSNIVKKLNNKIGSDEIKEIKV